MRYRHPTVLIVEDDEIDQESALRAFSRLEPKIRVTTESDGERALRWLQGLNGNEPVVVVLDLNMPRMDGFEFLAALRKDEYLGRISVFVYTTSDSAKDVQRAYQLGVAGYIVKSVEVGATEVARLVGMYCQLVRLPAGYCR